MSPQRTYHIIGGGIAGLAAAWYLKRHYPDIRSIIYEAAEYLGGRAYSYDDAGMEMRLDNAVHMIMGADCFMSGFVKKNEWCSRVPLIDMRDKELSFSYHRNLRQFFKLLCNTEPREISPAICRTIIRNTFPWSSRQRRVWCSEQNLSQRVINTLAAYADEIHPETRLHKIKAQFGVAAQLEFSNGCVDIAAGDKVIIALDNFNCSKVLPVIPLEHNQIVNIIYRTSQRIFLPGKISLIGVANGFTDRVCVNDKSLSVTIFNGSSRDEKLPEQALKSWQEVDKIRGVNSAFMPPYKALCCKNATICQDKGNNERRPDNALTIYPNVFLAGDWTMKNYPCRMETAVKSAIRAVKTAIKTM